MVPVNHAWTVQVQIPVCESNSPRTTESILVSAVYFVDIARGHTKSGILGTFLTFCYCCQEIKSTAHEALNMEAVNHLSMMEFWMAIGDSELLDL